MRKCIKLTKAKLTSSVKKGLLALGYKAVKDSITGAQGLFLKKVGPGFFLTLGLTIHRYYGSKFIGSFYLSKTTTWGSVWGDTPMNSYKRLGCFLNMTEGKALLSDQVQSYFDAWWDFDDADIIDCFTEAVRLTEDRFINQPRLLEAIAESTTINELAVLSHLTIDAVKTGENRGYDYLHVPTKPMDDIPMIWFEAAERVIRTKKAILNVNTVKRLAADAYRTNLYG